MDVMSSPMQVERIIELMQKEPVGSLVIAQWFSKEHAEANAGMRVGELTAEQWQAVVEKSAKFLEPIWSEAAEQITEIMNEVVKRWI